MENLEHLKYNNVENSIIKTGIDGFDNLFEEGGLPKGVRVLISGGSGSGKSILCRQISYNFLKNGGKCFYISFQESENGIKRSMKKFGWDIDHYLNSGSLIIQKINPLDILRMKFGSVGGSGSATEVSYKIKPFEIPSEFNPDVVVVDSLSSIIDVSTTKEKNFRLYLQQLFEFFEEINTVSLLISENNLTNNKYSNSGLEEYLADGLIVLHNFKKNERGIQVIKMRYSNHNKNIVFMNINPKGIEIIPEKNI
jgi:circadian clock protein KaiC